jgi:hypothetical protein
MKVLVSDTSVLIDLERGALVEWCFRLPLEFAVPDLLYRRELADYGGTELLNKGLRVEELLPAELAIAQDVRGHHAKLSLPDAYAFALASSRNWSLLAGDGELRAVARTRGLEWVGVLWLCDQMLEHRACGGGVLADSLEVIAAHPRCRLPRDEIVVRIERYRSKS